MSSPRQDIRHLYAHIPFCPTKCPYCAFVTHVGSTKLVTPYVQALQREISRRAVSLRGPLETVYLGGGTPSMLSPEQVGDVLTCVGRSFELAGGVEVTLEAHPNTVDDRSLEGYRAVGVNRLSMGIESLDPEVLMLAGRRYEVGRIAEVVRAVRRAGFDNVSLDLIYGLPGQTLDSWRDSLQNLLALGPDHVSSYPLSIEPGTVYSRGPQDFRFPDDGAVVEMYVAACDLLRGAGFEHYEVANWARPGKRSLHNLAYWLNEPFASVGVGAHGYLHGARYVNMRGVKRYIDVIGAGEDPHVSRETIDGAAELDEYLMLRLRLLTDGLDVEDVRARYGHDVARRVLAVAKSLPRQVQVQDGRIRLLESAVPLANSVWSEFLGLYPGALRALDLVS